MRSAITPTPRSYRARSRDPLHRSNWGTIAARAKRVANALRRLGVARSERIATLAWNHNRHLEIYFGVTCSGAVLHTVNPRLFPEQVRFIIDDAEASYVFFDVTFATLVEELAPKLPKVRGYVALCAREALPSINVPNLLCYEDLLAAETDDYAWPVFDENTASALCYTSGTTGNPKGVLQSHRSAVLHSLRTDVGRHDGDLGARVSVAVRAVVPCELLGNSVRRRRHRREGGTARHEA